MVGVPDVNVARVANREQAVARGVELDLVDVVLVSGERLDRRGVADVPDEDFAIESRRGDLLSVGADRD